jgi:UDP-2,3-diacylglucosamine pyrophosphatase LpxH
MSVTIFVSDTHVGPGLRPTPSDPNLHSWEWVTSSDRLRLAAFLQWLHPSGSVTATGAPKPDVDELVLLGDIFDNWIVPHDIKPPTMLELMRSQNASPIVTALGSLSQAINVIFVPGNHDMTVTGEVLAAVLPDVSFGGAALNKPFFSNGRLRAEHGNGPAMFNSPDPLRPDGLPLGYFISRLVATADRNTGSHTPSTSAIIHELGHILGKERLAQGVLDAVASKAGVSLDTKILMPDDLWGGQIVSVRQIRTMYAALAEEFEKRNGAIATAISIPAEMEQLEVVADAMLLRGGVGAIVMGHSHGPRAKQYEVPFLGRAAYVNSGCWCNNVSAATWVEVEKSAGAGGKRSTLSLRLMGCAGVDANGNLTGVAPFQAPVMA